MQRVRWQRTASLMAVGAYAQAQTLMEQVRVDLGDDLSVMDGPALSVYGSAHLRSAILAARPSERAGQVTRRKPGRTLTRPGWSLTAWARTATTTGWHSVRQMSPSMRWPSPSSWKTTKKPCGDRGESAWHPRCPQSAGDITTLTWPAVTSWPEIKPEHCAAWRKHAGSRRSRPAIIRWFVRRSWLSQQLAGARRTELVRVLARAQLNPSIENPAHWTVSMRVDLVQFKYVGRTECRFGENRVRRGVEVFGTYQRAADRSGHRWTGRPG
jgi:hypothetical protein